MSGAPSDLLPAVSFVAILAGVICALALVGGVERADDRRADAYPGGRQAARRDLIVTGWLYPVALSLLVFVGFLESYLPSAARLWATAMTILAVVSWSVLPAVREARLRLKRLFVGAAR